MSMSNEAARFNPYPVGQTPLSRGDGQPVILMCPPTFFNVAYAINPWMDLLKPADPVLAMRQWETLKTAIEAAGAQVEMLEPVEGLPDLVFTANAAFIHNQTAVIARYKHPERQGEEPVCATWFQQRGFDVVRMPDVLPFEGAGDALIWEDRVFAGYKTRTDIASHNLLTAATGLPVLSMELISDSFYHIDVCLCPLADGHLIYAPDTFDEYGLAVIEANVPPEKRIVVSAEESARFACNAVNINDTIIFNEGSPQLKATLEARGFKVVNVDLSEFLKSGGSSKCLTLRVG